MTVVARLESGPLDPAFELTELLDGSQCDGAIVSFLGVARPRTRDGLAVEQLILDHHPTLTLKSLERIAASAAERFAITQVRVSHRCGEMTPGEPIVFVGVSSEHRREAFEAADYLMDRLKTEAVFWKREQGASGTRWIEPTETDYADRERWE